MKILALEFSSAQRSVAVVDEPGPHGAAAAFEVVETGVSGAKLFVLIDEALRQARLEREQIECLVVGLGPGSYTGIRTAIALAQGWQLARPVRILGVSSLESIAAAAKNQSLLGRIVVVVDAQRREFYAATYEITSAACRPVEPLRLVTQAHLQEEIQGGALPVGPEVTSWFPKGRVIFPRAETLASLARDRTDFVSGEQLEPIYLRPTSFVKAPPPRQL